MTKQKHKLMIVLMAFFSQIFFSACVISNESAELVFPSELREDEKYITAPDGSTLDMYGTWNKIYVVQSGANNNEDNFEEAYLQDTPMQYNMLIDIHNIDTCIINNKDNGEYIKDQFKYLVNDKKIVGFSLGGYLWKIESIANDKAKFVVSSMDNQDSKYGKDFIRTITLQKLPRAEVHVYIKDSENGIKECELTKQMIWSEMAQFDEENIYIGQVCADALLSLEGLTELTLEQINKIEYSGEVQMTIFKSDNDNVIQNGLTSDEVFYSGDVIELPTEAGEYVICFMLYDRFAAGRDHHRIYFILKN